MQSTPIVILSFLLLAGCAKTSHSSNAPLIAIQCTGSDTLQAEFVQKHRTESDGYQVLIRFTNTGTEDIRTLSTNCHLFESGWKIRNWGVQMSAVPALIPAGESKEIEWIDGISTSIDRIDIEVLNAK